jgi:hypothetical protein
VAASFVKEVGFVANASAGSTSAITVAAGGVALGDVIVILGSCDNAGASGIATTIAAADNHAGTTNVYTLRTPQAIADPGAASAGAQTFILHCPVTTALSAGDIITITFGNSLTSKAICSEQFTGLRADSGLFLPGSYTTQDNQTGQSVSVSTTPSRAGQLVIGLVGIETNASDGFTADTDTTNGSWVLPTTRTGDGGTAGTSITIRPFYKIVTAPGTQTWDGATMLGTARDYCSAIVTLDIPSDPRRVMPQGIEGGQRTMVVARKRAA